MSSQDEVLEYLIKRVEETGLGTSITLSVNGSTISGEMISSKRYFDEMSNYFSEDNITADDRALREKWLSYMQHVKQFLQQKGRGREEQHDPKYIHLRDVVIYPSDPSDPSAAGAWRGKLSSVDGFSVGRGHLQVRSDEEEEEEENDDEEVTEQG
jgi:hypothetical protein